MNKGGGGERTIGGGVQNSFWGGVLRYVFPSPESSTPLCFSLLLAPTINPHFGPPEEKMCLICQVPRMVGFTTRTNVFQLRRFVAQNDQEIKGFGMLTRNLPRIRSEVAWTRSSFGICSEFARKNGPNQPCAELSSLISWE